MILEFCDFSVYSCLFVVYLSNPLPEGSQPAGVTACRCHCLQVSLPAGVRARRCPCRQVSMPAGVTACLLYIFLFGSSICLVFFVVKRRHQFFQSTYLLYCMSASSPSCLFFLLTAFCLLYYLCLFISACMSTSDGPETCLSFIYSACHIHMHFSPCPLGCLPSVCLNTWLSALLHV